MSATPTRATDPRSRWRAVWAVVRRLACRIGAAARAANAARVPF